MWLGSPNWSTVFCSSSCAALRASPSGEAAPSSESVSVSVKAHLSPAALHPTPRDPCIHVTCQLCLEPSSRESALGPSAVCSFYWQTEQFIGILWLRGCKRVSALPQIHPYLLISWTQVATLSKYKGKSASQFQPLPNLEGASSDGRRYVLV